jgi:hypothetical protein
MRAAYLAALRRKVCDRPTDKIEIVLPTGTTEVAQVLRALDRARQAEGR